MYDAADVRKQKSLRGMFMIHFKKPSFILAVLAILALVLSGCEPTAAQTSATASPTGAAVTVSPSESPKASPTVTPGGTARPTASPLRESNLYVLGAFMQRTAYVDTQTGYVMLPLQVTAEKLGATFSWDSVAGQVTLGTQQGEAVVSAGENGGYVLTIGGEQVNDLKGTQLLQMQGGAVYAPAFLVEAVFDVAVSTNRAGDTLVALPQPEQTPAPGGNTADPDAGL